MEFSKLNKAQKVAITTNKGPKLVIAGAGTGKTQVLSFRFAYLVKHMNLDPGRILVVTFAKSAGVNMKNRILSLVPNYGAKGLWIGHIHSITKQALEDWEYRHKGEKWGILSEGVAMEKIKVWGGGKYKDLDFEVLVDIIGVVKLEEYTRKDRDLDEIIIEVLKRYGNKKAYPSLEECKELYEIYKSKLKEKKLWDFSDLIIEFHRRISTDVDIGFKKEWGNKFDYILFDEFQDINKIQLEIIYALNREGNIFCVGDPDQSIYGFRGSVPDVFIEFKNYWEIRGHKVEIIKLLENYRSSPEIINISNALISDNYKQNTENLLKKELIANNKCEGPVELYRSNNRGWEVRWIVQRIIDLYRKGVDLSEICILGRAKSHYKEITKRLSREGIPCISNEIYENVRKKFVRDWVALIGFVTTKKADVEKRDLHLSRILTFDHTITEHAKGRLLIAAKEKNMSIADQMKRVSNPKFQADDIDVRVGELWLKLCSLKRACKGDDVVVKMKKCVLAYNMWKILTKEKIDEHMLDLKKLSSNNATARRLSEYVMEDKADLTDLEHRLSSKVNMVASKSRVSLMTIHKAKGLEWDYVFITRMDDGKIPHKRAIQTSKEGIYEERRLAYVAFTRPRKKLFISSSGFKKGKPNLSRFICEGTLVWEHPDMNKLDIDLAPEDVREEYVDPEDVVGFNQEFSKCLNSLGNEDDWDDDLE